MTKFRERSTAIEVEAFQWWGEGAPGLERIDVGLDELSSPSFKLVIHTPNGTRYAAEGDWIVTRPDGWVRIYGPEEFAAVYQHDELGDLFRGMNPENRALFESIDALREKIGPVKFNIVESLRELRENR